MKRVLLYLALMIVSIISMLFVCGCGDTSKLAGMAAITEEEQVQGQDPEASSDQTAQTKDLTNTKAKGSGNKKNEAKKLVKEIDELDEVTLDSRNQLDSLRIRYDALSDKDKKAVENYDKLTAAEEEYEALADEEAKLNCTVWITKTGDCYHLEGCHYLRSKYESMTQEEAINRGYSACSECISAYWRPKYLTNSD